MPGMVHGGYAGVPMCVVPRGLEGVGVPMAAAGAVPGLLLGHSGAHVATMGVGVGTGHHLHMKGVQHSAPMAPPGFTGMMQNAPATSQHMEGNPQ